MVMPERSAPDMGDADALQLRKQGLHPRDQRRGDVGGEADAVAFAPAEEKPAIALKR
jgi:hypothetical protein